MMSALQATDASSGRDAEFAAFYRRELAAQVRRATLLVGDNQLAKDLVHDSFADVFAKWDSLREPGPYLNIAVMNRCRDHGRRAAMTERRLRLLLPDGFSTDTWRQVSAGGQMVFTSPEVQGTQHTATQQLDTGWLTSSSDSSAPNVSALGSVEVDSAGTLTLSSPGLEVIASYDIPSGSMGEGTYSEAYGPGDAYVVVETVSGEIPLVAVVADRASHLEPMTVNGDAAWHASGFDVDGEWHAIAWEFSRQQSVFVSNHDSYDTLLAVAESLEVVDEATWTAATT